MQPERPIETLIERLKDPTRCGHALLGLIGEGKAAAPALAAFLRSAKPSTLPEARLLAVEGLSILKGSEALDALIAIATERLADISDPVVRLAEESIASRAAFALAGFFDQRARDTLLDLVKGKPLIGVAEAFERLKDSRALPYLIDWLEDDFVAGPARRAILAQGRAAIAALLKSLEERRFEHGDETRLSQRRRVRILEILDDLCETNETQPFEQHFDNPEEEIRLAAARGILHRGSPGRQRQAFMLLFQLLDARERATHTAAEELLREHLSVGYDLLAEEIEKRRAQGEPEDEFFPRESTLSLLVRIQRQSGSFFRGP